MKSPLTGEPVIYCAIDTKDLDHAKHLAGSLSQTGCGIKLGLEFFNMHGPQGVQAVCNECPGASVFLDLKYHDIPNTVAGAVASVSRLNASYLNVHASGGEAMMHAARLSCAPKTRLIAVTVLTSLGNEALETVGQQADALEQVKRLALLTKRAGLAGIVCSAHEIRAVRETCGDDFVLMVPGIRPEGSDTDDQQRVMTPAQAMEAGATHLVIGRPITKASNPAEAARRIIGSLENIV